MYLTCPRCQTTNERDALFCKTCGNGFNVKPIRKNSIATPVIIIVAVLAVCGFCGLFGLISGNKKEVAQSSNYNVKSLVSATLPGNKATGSNIAEILDTVEGEQVATVITKNVNLRKTGSASGEVIQTLPKNSTVEIIRQSGAWFYVRAAGSMGWLHGNAIRLNENDSKPAPTVAETYSAPRQTRPFAPEPVINNTGATAKCGDGSLSYSAHRRGTCSHHGGVALWY